MYYLEPIVASVVKKILITSALPYVNNVPHLGNLIQVLSADVYARYCRLRGHETLYICGTDEYGTATETRALEEGLTPQELCDRYYKIHDEVYRWFNIAFDRFGRTSTPKHTEITQSIFHDLDKHGFIIEKTVEQTYCEHDQRFLADRYVRGTCPHCAYPEARGDQCENCGKLLDPVDLVEPRCGICGQEPVVRKSDHLYIDLPGIMPRLKVWLDKAAVEGHWVRNAVQMTQAWIRDGLHERCITRDLKWGIPVPKDGYRDKVFYVWFDAPIGYISMTANHTDQWEKWWKNQAEVELVQFVGKDNIPFHTVIFPSSLIGGGEPWTLLHHMSSTEYLNYESGKFSKSKGIGVFGTDARETGIPAEVWRFYLFYNRPERSDTVFTWLDFKEKVNSELIGNLANLVNRTLTFVSKNFAGILPDSEEDTNFWGEVRQAEAGITEALERVNLRDGFRRIFALSSLGNKRFQDGEPWKAVKEDKQRAAALLRDLVYLIRDLAILIRPYLPGTSERINSFLGIESQGWDRLGVLSGIETMGRPELLFRRLEDKQIESLRKRFAGTAGEQAGTTGGDAGNTNRQAGTTGGDAGNTNRSADKPSEQARKGGEPSGQPAEQLSGQQLSLAFQDKVELKAARITEIHRHARADKLYIETIDLGGETRQIVSGLVPHYREEELLGRTIILVCNLKAAKLRGEESCGMLLAADDGKRVEVLFVDHAKAGDPVQLSEYVGQAIEPRAEIDIDEFFLLPMKVEEYQVVVGGSPLVCSGRAVTCEKVKSGQVG